MAIVETPVNGKCPHCGACIYETYELTNNGETMNCVREFCKECGYEYKFTSADCIDN